MAAAITTTFAGPLSCAQSVGGLTMLQGDAYRIWLNAPIPVPGVTISSCYPPQFMSSFLSQRAGSPQSAFRALVCPSGYATQAKYANNYIACCPRYISLLPLTEVDFNKESLVVGMASHLPQVHQQTALPPAPPAIQTSTTCR